MVAIQEHLRHLPSLRNHEICERVFWKSRGYGRQASSTRHSRAVGRRIACVSCQHHVVVIKIRATAATDQHRRNCAPEDSGLRRGGGQGEQGTGAGRGAGMATTWLRAGVPRAWCGLVLSPQAPRCSLPPRCRAAPRTLCRARFTVDDPQLRLLQRADLRRACLRRR
eukprot:gene7720-biopygen22561